MSSYYGNIIPANLPNGGTQDPFLTQEGKYDPNNYYGGGGTPGLGGGYGAGEGDPQHPGFPRFPPFDRLDIRPITSKTGYSPASVHTSLTNGVNPAGYPQTSPLGPQYGQNPQATGQYPHHTQEDLGPCKVAEGPGQQLGHGPSPPTAHSPTGHQQPPHPGSLHPHHPYQTASHPLGGVVNGVQPQNIPIYPWMRPVNGGKLLFLLSNLSVSLLWYSLSVASQPGLSPFHTLTPIPLTLRVSLPVTIVT